MAKNKSLTSGGIYYLLYNVLNVAFPLVSGIYVSRKLLPSDIGTVTAAQNLAQYFFLLSFLGVPAYGLREISKTRNDRDERNQIFSELFIINLISTIVFLAAYILLIFLVKAYRDELVLYLVVGISVALNIFNISWIFEGLEEFRFISLRNLAFKILTFALLVIFVRGKEDYLNYACVSVVGTAGHYVINVFFAPKFVRFTTKKLNLKRHLKPVFYLAAVNLAIEIYSLMDITMMNFMSTKESIAFYKYGHNIQRMLAQVVNTFTLVLIPRISFYYKEKRYDEFNDLLSKTLRIIIIVAVPMIVGVQFTSDFLLTQIYGEEYIASSYILKMFSVLLLITPIGYLLGSRVLLATDHENKMFISVGAGAVVNLIGNALLIPHYNEYGAAIATIVSEVVVMVVYVELGRKYFKLKNVHRTVGRVAAAAAVMALYLWGCTGLSGNGWVVLLAQVAVAPLIYFTVMYFLKDDIIQYYADMFLKRLRR